MAAHQAKKKSLRIVSKKCHTDMVPVVRVSIAALMAKNRAFSNDSHQTTKQDFDIKSIENSS